MNQEPPPIELPDLPAEFDNFMEYLVNSRREGRSYRQILDPYLIYETQMRTIFAQVLEHPVLSHHIVTPLFHSFTHRVNVHVRIEREDGDREQGHYLMPWKEPHHGIIQPPHAMVPSLEDFQRNFAAFSCNTFVDSALGKFDWRNVVVAGGGATMPLLPVPDVHTRSPSDLLKFFQFAQTSSADIDLFIHGLDEEAAIDKIEKIVDFLQVTTPRHIVRTKNAITIVGEYPQRHIQIILRLYRSISEILTGFDVDCACVAYDGQQVYANPRAIVAHMARTNTIDLTRRSPSYENRLAKYATRGFQIFWPELDRDRVDSRIFSLSPSMTTGLARLLVLEHQIASDHETLDNFMDGRNTSNYATHKIPYGPGISVSHVLRYLGKWHGHLEGGLHRHPALISTSIKEVIEGRCCLCPISTSSDMEIMANSLEYQYVSGRLSFKTHDPGRQTIGSFTPLTTHDWTVMA